MSRKGALRWHNHAGNQTCYPRSIERPQTLEQLSELVRRAEREGTTIRAVGAGHAWSDVALTNGLLVDPARLGGPLLELDDGCLRPGAAGEPLARVLAGTHLRHANPALYDAGLALPNMGGYDAQTVAGVVSTATHGSGLAFGSFSDLVRSLDMVVSGGEVVRVEPAGGMTDPLAFRARHGSDRRLIQDDDHFAAAACGMGCLGILHSVVLRVVPRYWLNEVRRVDTWEAVRGALTADGVLGGHEHYELFLNPYPGKDGTHRLLVTTRERTSDPARLPEDKRERHPLTELESAFPGTWIVLRLAARFFPSLMAGRFDWLLNSMRDDGYAGRSYEVYNIGAANRIPAFSSELGVSLEGNRHLEAVDRILEIARERRERERLYHTSPIALRFVAPSPAYASMMYGRPTMMIELIMGADTRGGYDLLAGYEERLADLDVRPHWGQYNTLSAASDLRALYPRWEDWLRVYDEFNASGVFNSPFTDRIGISRPGP
ncbi:MAG: FAD-binding protein [Actinomycetota bacterium]|nr:FAD-binding protein [Actinomycetota bacterium]